jgi:hypothetical protein
MTEEDKAMEGDMLNLEEENQGVNEASSEEEEDRDTFEVIMVCRKDLTGVVH